MEQVIMVCKEELERLKQKVPAQLASCLVYSKSYTPQVVFSPPFLFISEVERQLSTHSMIH